MKRLIIIVPLGGDFYKYLRRFRFTYHLYVKSPSYACFSYEGELLPKDKVSEILSIHDFRTYTLRKIGNSYIFRVWVE